MTQATMHAVQAQEAGAPFVNVELPVPEPKPGQVRVKVHACGICGGDEIPREGLFGTQLPRVPGHEIGGVVDAVGDGVTMWQVGDRVGVGWSGGSDLTCEFCRRGDFTNCVNRTITGANFDGGYAEYMVAPQDAVARAPEGLPFEEIAPMMCGGITAFNGLRALQGRSWRSRRGSRRRRGRPPRRPVRRQDGLPRRRHRARSCP